MNPAKTAFALLSHVGLFLASGASAEAWQLITNGLPSNPTISQISGDGNLAALTSSQGIYISTNAGENWFKATGTLPGSSQSANRLMVVGNRIFASRDNQTLSLNSVVRSSDFGATWQTSGGITNKSIDLLATDGTAVFAGKTGNGIVWRSTDNGENWEPISSATGSFNNGTLRALGGSNGRILAATSSGIYSLSGSGTNWIQASADGNTLLATRMAAHGEKTFLLYGDLGRRVLAIPDGTTTVLNATNGLPEGEFNISTYRDIAASEDSLFVSATLYSSADFGNVAKLFQSTDQGANWNSISTPLGILGAPQSICVASSNLLLALNETYPSGLFRVRLVNGVPFFAPTVSGLPALINVHPESELVLNVTVQGEGTISLQWSKDGVDLPGETSATLTLSNIQTNDAGDYTLTASNPGGSARATVKINVFPRGPGLPNLDFNPGYFASDRFGFGMLNATPFAVATLTNGQVLVGGDFTHVNTELNSDGFSYTNGVRQQGIALLNPDGSADLNFAAAPGIDSNGSVLAICVQSDGRILVGGQFVSYNGFAQTNITRLEADGSLDLSFATNAFNNNAMVQQIEVQSDGKILIRGSFSSINGVARSGIARLNSDGSLDTSWPVGSGASSVNEIAIGVGDQVLIGGSFFSFNGNNAYKYLVSLDSTGTLESSFNPGLNSSVMEMEMQPGGMFWVTGFFTKYGTANVPSIIRLAPDGTLASVASTNLNNAQRLVSQEDGKLIFVFYNSSKGTYGLIRLDAEGSEDPTFTGGSFTIAPQSMALSRSGDLYAVGTFNSYNGIAVPKMVRIYATETNVPATLPQFISQPNAAFGLFGSSVTLRGIVAGQMPITFFWLKDGIPLENATSSVLSLTNLSEEMLGDYRLVANNSFGSVTSLVATVSSATAPSIVQQPPAVTGSTNGGNAILSVVANGTPPLFYQWYRNSGLQAGFTNNPQTLTNLNASLTGNWIVVVTNLYGRATSSICSVQIGTPPGFFRQPDNQVLNGEGNFTISTTASGTSSTPLTFLWYHNNELVHTHTTNSLLNEFTVSNAVPADGGNYYVVITNFAGSITSLTRTVTIRNPFLAQQPETIVAVQGVTTNFAALATGTQPIEYYWFRRNFGSPATTNFLGTGPTLTFSPLTRADGQGNYFVVASNIWGAVTSSLRSVTVQFPTVITNISSTNIIAELNEFVIFSVQYEAQPTPTVRWYKDGVLQPELFSPFVSFNSVQASNAGTYQLVLSNFINSVTSAPIVLTVKEPRGPSIVEEPPATLVVHNSGSIGLGFIADGTPKMYYRWFKEDGTPVSNWNTFASLSLSPITTDNSGNYFAIVTNAYGSATTKLASVSVIVPQPAAFQNKKFVKIADSFRVVPGLSPLRFTGFRDAFIRNREVWFTASAGAIQYPAGIYHWSNNTLESLVNTNTPVPGSSSRFTNFFGSTFLSDGKVIFGAYGSGDEHGLYAWTNQSVIKLYDTTTVVPGRTETFGRFGWPTVYGNQFAFLGFSLRITNDWLYRGVFISSNGVLTKLADTNSTLPGLGGHFVGCSSQVGFDGNKVAWWAWNEETNGGIFSVTRALTLKNIADEFTVNPATGQNFDGFISPPNVVTGRVYFVGHDVDFNTSLFYGDGTGPIQTIAKPGDIIPGRGMTFDSIAYPAQMGTTAGNFFGGNAAGNYSGIFFWNGSEAAKVIDELDTLDGETISFVHVANADGTDLLFYVSFTSGREALYAMISDSTATFDQWASAFTFPAGQSDPEDDADGDGIKNAFEYYFGSNPTSAVSGAMPTGSSVNVGGQNYPAITFIRSKNAGGVTLVPQASSDVNFSQLLGTMVDSVVDLGNGTERVTIRSTVNSATQGTQFLRIQLTIP